MNISLLISVLARLSENQAPPAGTWHRQHILIADIVSLQGMPGCDQIHFTTRAETGTAKGCSWHLRTFCLMLPARLTRK
jgi:hypothetical protein